MHRSKIADGVMSGTQDRQLEIVILPDRAALAREAASRFVLIANQAIVARRRFAVVLSGGSTPRDLYQLLATPEFSSKVDWRHTYLFWGDERAVPPNHLDSNFRMASEALISRVPILQANVHRIPAELEPVEAAREYVQTMLSCIKSGAIAESEAGLPRFDLILLGLGDDAHTASLFPQTRALGEITRWTAENYVEKLNAFRITLTLSVINAAKNILFLVAGADKSVAVDTILQGKRNPHEFPAQMVEPTNGRVVWLLDKAASAKLTTTPVSRFR